MFFKSPRVVFGVTDPCKIEFLISILTFILTVIYQYILLVVIYSLFAIPYWLFPIGPIGYSLLGRVALGKPTQGPEKAMWDGAAHPDICVAACSGAGGRKESVGNRD